MWIGAPSPSPILLTTCSCVPVVVGGCQDNGGAGVGVAGDPGAVDSEEHQKHHEQQDNDGTHVGRTGQVTGLVGGVQGRLHRP